jgi:hypothetical protein
MNAEELEREFRPRGVPYGDGLLLLAADDALEFVRRAEAAGVAILGVDGMFVSPTATVSPIEHIADFSAAVARGEGCWAYGREFIEDRRLLGMVFEVTLDGPGEVPPNEALEQTWPGTHHGNPPSVPIERSGRHRASKRRPRS